MSHFTCWHSEIRFRPFCFFYMPQKILYLVILLMPFLCLLSLIPPSLFAYKRQAVVMVTSLDLSVMRDIWPVTRGETSLWSCFSSAQTPWASRGGSCLPKPVTPITSSSSVSAFRVPESLANRGFRSLSSTAWTLLPFLEGEIISEWFSSLCHFISICIIYKIPFWWLHSRFFDSFYLSGLKNIGISLMLTRVYAVQFRFQVVCNDACYSLAFTLSETKRHLISIDL